MHKTQLSLCPPSFIARLGGSWSKRSVYSSWRYTANVISLCVILS